MTSPPQLAVARRDIVTQCGRVLDVASANWWNEERRRGLNTPLLWALVVSVLLHVGGILGWEGTRLLVRAFPDLFPGWVRDKVEPKEVVKRVELQPDPLKPRPAAEQEVEIPLTFIEVDPSQSVKDPPKEAKYYSTESTLAGNPAPPKPGATQPLVDGRRPDIPSTRDVLKPSPPEPVAAPAPPPTPVVEVPKPAPAPAKEVKPQPALPAQERVEKQVAGGPKPGETQLAKVNPEAVVDRPQPRRDPREAQPARPEQAAVPELQPVRRPIKRLAEAREQKGIIVAEKMKQDGGVDRLTIESSMDVKASPFGNYDRAFIAAVQQRWYKLLEEHHYGFERSGKVVLRFRLRSDGTVTDMTQLESEVGDVWAFLCESAVLTQSPFARWPLEMRRMIGADVREITFTFHYYL